MKIGFYAGSFDPFTVGHLHVTKLASELFDKVVVGIGINVNSNPTVDSYKTTKLDNYSEIPMNELLNRLMRNIDKWRRADFRAVRARWTELAACINRPVKYQGEMAELVGINENGALVLRRGSRYLLVYGDEITV